MERLWGGLTRLAHAAILAGGVLLFVAALIVTAEVMVRKAIPDLIDLVAWCAGLFKTDLRAWADATGLWVKNHFGFSGSDEISGYLFAIGTSWAMAHVLITRGHVRIDALYGGLPARVRAALDIISLLLLIVFIGALLERAFNVTSINFVEYNRSNSNLRVPLAWPQIPWLLGIALFLLTAVVAVIRAALAFISGDLAAVNAIAGASSQDEEIESELKGLGIEAPQVGKR